MAEYFRCAEQDLLAGNEGITRSAAGIVNTAAFRCKKSRPAGGSKRNTSDFILITVRRSHRPDLSLKKIAVTASASGKWVHDSVCMTVSLNRIK